MMMSVMMILSVSYTLLMGSFYSLTLLLTMEMMVLLCLMNMFYSEMSWMTSIMFLLVSVCLGGYGVSIYVCMVRSKGYMYFFSF